MTAILFSNTRWLGILIATIALCVALLLAPHHVRGPQSFGPFTLSGMLREGLAVVLEGPAIPASFIVLLAALALLFTLFYPALFIVMLRYTGNRGLYLFGGIVAALGAVVGYFAMVFSQTAIGFGGGSPLRPATPFLWIIPAVHLAFAAASVAVGCTNRLP